MSRGHGQKQRLILRAIEQCGPFYLATLCDGDFKTSYKAFHRAARRLEDEGLLVIRSYLCGHPRLLVHDGSLKTVNKYFPLVGGGETFTLDRKDIKVSSDRVRELLTSGQLNVEAVTS